MSKQKTASKKATQKDAAASEKLRKEAMAVVEQNLAKLDGKATPEKPKSAKPKVAKPAKASKRGGKISGLAAAAKVLAASKEPLNAVTIAERAIAAGWKTNGKTPNATLYAAMLREIQTKGKESRFVKKDRGLFTAAKGA